MSIPTGQSFVTGDGVVIRAVVRHGMFSSDGLIGVEVGDLQTVVFVRPGDAELVSCHIEVGDEVRARQPNGERWGDGLTGIVKAVVGEEAWVRFGHMDVVCARDCLLRTRTCRQVAEAPVALILRGSETA